MGKRLKPLVNLLGWNQVPAHPRRKLDQNPVGAVSSSQVSPGPVLEVADPLALQVVIAPSPRLPVSFSESQQTS